MKKLILTLSLAVASLAQAGNLKYVNGSEFPLIGKGIADDASAARYQRLPDSIQSQLPREFLWFLGRNTSGLALRFASDSPYINAKWTNSDKIDMNHMPATGIRGIDLYTLDDNGRWQFVNTGRPSLESATTELTVNANMKPGVMREYIMFLPLYDGISDIAIGYDDDYTLTTPQRPELPATGNPIVVYGTSITQGGCASRPGMSYTNILTRKLNREFVNFGFSGNGQLDLEIAPVVAGVENPSLFIMDYCANVTKEIIEDKMLDFIKIIREKHPDVPILFVENPSFPFARYDLDMAAKVESRNKALKEHYEILAAGGDKNLYYLSTEGLIGNDGEATVDGIHLTDLGFYRLSQVLESAIKAIL